jgi:hypothetical protein
MTTRRTLGAAAAALVLASAPPLIASAQINDPAARRPGTAQPADAEDSGWGWIGLIGLAGVLGLFGNRTPQRREHQFAGGRSAEQSAPTTR